METNSGLTTDNSDLAHLQCTGLQEVEGYFDLKPPHGEYQPLPPAGSNCKTVITGLKLAKKYSVACVLQNTNQENI
jgi:hypothetical protein